MCCPRQYAISANALQVQPDIAERIELKQL
jgi:hypothetical protein